MVKLILLLLLFRIDNSSTVVDTFDRIEVNHHYNEWGAEDRDWETTKRYISTT